MPTPPLLLVPSPRSLTLTGGEYFLTEGQLILLDYERGQPQLLLSTAQRFERALQSRCGLNWGAAGSRIIPGDQVALAIRVRQPEEGATAAEAYELSISPSGITLTAGSPAGAFYGICTLIQLVELYGTSLSCLQIQDWPDYPVRGVMLDVSRERVPHMQTLYDLVDRLAGWKINQLQLYFEHAFAYRRHPRVWENVSPFTAQEIMELDRYCRERYIELVPNQQSFGHLAPWLNLPEYKHLAEVADGFETPWGLRPGSFSLAPTHPGSIEFLRGLYAELLPHFTSKMVNVGGDESWDLGQGQSREACEQYGKGRVYLNFMLQIYREVKRIGFTPQIWGDIIVEYPELIPELPRDIILLEWGYEADHPFDTHGALFAASGIPFYVCPGTSSWCSLAGRSDNAVTNLQRAAEHGLAHGACGYLNTDWGDYGHWQAWPVSYLGLLCGAAYSWCLESSRALDIAEALSWQAFRDRSGRMGRLAFDLGNLYQALSPRPHNSSLLFWILQWPMDKIRAHPGISPQRLRAVEASIDALAAGLEEVRIGCAEGEQIRDEFRLTIRLLRHACRRGMLALAEGTAEAARLRAELLEDLTGLVAEYRRCWLLRNRPGGLAESSARLEKLTSDYQ